MVWRWDLYGQGLGTKVTVVEKLDRIVPTMDGEIATEFMKSLEKQGLEFKLSHKVVVY